MHTGRIVPIYEKAGTMTAADAARAGASLPCSSYRQMSPTRCLPRFANGADWSVAAAALPSGGALSAGIECRAGEQRDVHRFAQCVSTPAHQRLIFEEFFLFQAGLVLRKRRHAETRNRGPSPVDDRIRESARKVLPFKLTDGQKVALREIVDDMRRPEPMNRLLQGDVGSGKTIVALLAALVAMENGFQVAFMAPTEILADQHYLTIRRLLDLTLPHRLAYRRSTPAKRREVHAETRERHVAARHRHARARRGRPAFHELGLVIIDEQHRFGVMQRASLRAKGSIRTCS